MWVTAPFKPAGFFPNKKTGSGRSSPVSLTVLKKSRAKKVNPGFAADLL